MHAHAAGRVSHASASRGSRVYPSLALELSSLDLGEIAEALADQTDYEHRWLINPATGEIVFWTADTGIGGRTPVDLDDLDLVCIDPCRPGSGTRRWRTSPGDRTQICPVRSDTRWADEAVDEGAASPRRAD